MDSSDGQPADNVYDIFSGLPLSTNDSQRIVRLSAELDGLEMLYSNESQGNKLFSLKVLCWALRDNGEVVGMVPWLGDIVACTEICDPLKGQWEGYFDPGIDEVFFEPPIHKIVELETAAEYFEYDCDTGRDVVQEIPDTIGTHAVLSENGFHSITLTEVVSWRLHHDGRISAMLVDEQQVAETPVLAGDECLFEAQQHKAFKYFFQHQIANKIKAQDPEALEAIALLVDQ